MKHAQEDKTKSVNEQKSYDLIRPNTKLSDSEANGICDIIRECGFGLHRYLGPGFREKVYERGLVHRLSKHGVKLQVQPRIMIYDEDGTALIEENMDLIVEDAVILELKAVRETSDADVAQLLGYLKATKFRHGLLINFGAPKILHQEICHVDSPEKA